MEIKVADNRIFLFSDVISAEDAKQKAWEKKISAFDAASKIVGFLSRTKDDDFELLYQEHRYQPFWHVIAESKYVYDRTADYQVPVTGPVVKSVTFKGEDQETKSGMFRLSVIEHCAQEGKDEVFINGVTGRNTPELKQYLALSPRLVSGELAKEVNDKSILVPPQTRVSALIRDALAKMITGIQADRILEEHVGVSCVDLYYHPVHAFQYRWISKNKEGILEVDGLTGEVTSGTRVFSEYLGRVLDRNFLFDLGADATGMLIPGGNIAVKVAKHYLDTKDRQ